MADTERPRILVVDDEPEHAATLVRLLKRERIDADAVHDVREALDRLRAEPWDVVLTDLVMPGPSGIDLLRAIPHLDVSPDVVLMTAFGTVEKAVEAMQNGASDFIVKPIKRAALMKSLRRSLERARLARENERLKSEVDRLRGAPSLVGADPSFQRALALVRQAATSEASVLVFGESGTGKELFARELHRASNRAAGPFVALHCAALPESIIESELFGHEAGAFTGARKRHVGRFEAAHGGTLFLDEIGELSANVQVKLLRALQEGEVRRLGGDDPVRVDVRIVAATHRDLTRMVATGDFREDLFYRLHVIPVTIPPLRDRGEDIVVLARTFLHRSRDPAPALTDAARRALMAWRWPGNVRELENVVQRAVVLDTDGVIDTDDLPAELVDGAAAAGDREVVAVPVGTTIAEMERRLILATLAHTGDDKAVAASLLGVGRRTIYRKLDEYRDDESG